MGPPGWAWTPKHAVEPPGWTPFPGTPSPLGGALGPPKLDVGPRGAALGPQVRITTPAATFGPPRQDVGPPREQSDPEVRIGTPAAVLRPLKQDMGPCGGTWTTRQDVRPRGRAQTLKTGCRTPPRQGSTRPARLGPQGPKAGSGSPGEALGPPGPDHRSRAEAGEARVWGSARSGSDAGAWPRWRHYLARASAQETLVPGGEVPGLPAADYSRQSGGGGHVTSGDQWGARTGTRPPRGPAPSAPASAGCGPCGPPSAQGPG